MPMEVSPISTRLNSQCSANAVSFLVRSSTIGCLRMAFPGIITYFAMFFSYFFGSGITRSPVSTILWEWDTRVHIFTIKGVSNSSESSKALFTKWYASAESDGSSIGTFAAMA